MVQRPHQLDLLEQQPDATACNCVQAGVTSLEHKKEDAFKDLDNLQVQNAELTEELTWAVREVCTLRRQKNEWQCRKWLAHSEGLSTVLGHGRADKAEAVDDASDGAGRGLADHPTSLAAGADAGAGTLLSNCSGHANSLDAALYSDPACIQRLAGQP